MENDNKNKGVAGTIYSYGNHLFNDGWEFAKQPLHTELEMLEELQPDFQPVGLPHDWLIYQASDLYEDGTGWYRKELLCSLQEEKRVFLRFEGIYMDSAVFINNQKAGEWKYGYSTFEVEITSFLVEGINEIKVSVDHQAPNSRWYSGAGIYRDVWLKVQHPTRIASDGVYITTHEIEQDQWQIEIAAEVESPGTAVLEHLLFDLQTGEEKPVCWKEKQMEDMLADGIGGCQIVSFIGKVSNPVCWDIAAPYRYEVQTRLLLDGKLLQEEKNTTGFRAVEFKPDEGFLLNGRKVKLNGVCEHHDLGCLGAAYSRSAMRRKFTVLQKMGVNAVRLSHNMPAPDVMELADEMGILVVSEAFDMWERPKTTYDYARFFPEWYQRDIASWVRRDRNHPSLIMWSIGNEIYDTHVGARGQELTRMLLAEVKKHDPDNHAMITIGSNYMPWENAQKCADIIKLAGYNYAEKYYDLHHQEHPDWIIYGSETASTVQSRGVYHFPFSQSVLADEDEQCSALGNSTTSWGAKSSESCIIAERDHYFSCGQFLWTGFDYIGEPTPYHTRNSYFGQVDTAGFPKDSYYIYQAEWTDYRKEPMVHIFPYWDFNEGQLVDIRVCSNAPAVELFVNGESKGSFKIDHAHGEQLAGHWRVPFAKGEIKALAYDESGRIIAEETRNSFGEAAKIMLKSDKNSLQADGKELAFVEISMADENGNPVENANNRVTVRVSGAGYLAGLDNGDSTDKDEYKTYSRRLFNGKLLAVAAADFKEGEICLEVSSKGMADARIVIPVQPCQKTEGAGSRAYGVVETTEEKREAEEVPVRAIRLYSENGTCLDAGSTDTVVKAEICPANADDREVVWCAVNDAGIPSNLAEVSADGLEAKVTAKGDGTFRLRCMSKSGTQHIRIISELDFSVSGLGETYLNPYEFISGGLYDYSSGTVSNGNERGVATARDGETQIGFHGIDFGDFGSDEITIPIFALTDEEYPIQIWEGMPRDAGSQMLADVIYQKPSKWNVYQEETYRLSRRLKGITSICFVLRQKVHIKGFSFSHLDKAYQKLQAGECDRVYGDSFVLAGDGIDNIGNNVTIEFLNMEFGDKGARKLTVCGYTPMEKNAIQLRFASEEGESMQLIEFVHEEEVSEQSFFLEPAAGMQSVSFVFLPGSKFDFKWFMFEKA